MQFESGLLHIGSPSAHDLAAKYGTPLYVYDAAAIRRQVERVKRAFSRLPFRPFFAMKANSNAAILRLVREHGFGCDAVSPGEIFIAKHAGFTSDEIWFTCSNVSDDDLRAINDARIVINVNSVSEIDRILSLGLQNPVALRVNPDVGAGHHADVVTAGEGVKFGIDIAEVRDARMIVEDTGRRVVGLHAHIGSGVDTIAPLLDSARRLLDPVQAGRSGVPDRRVRRWPHHDRRQTASRERDRRDPRAGTLRRRAVRVPPRARYGAAHQRRHDLGWRRHRFQSPRPSVEV